MIRALMILALIASCSGEHRSARDVYNSGVAALAKGDFEAAQKLLLDARSKAGVDPELRFRAAYDLGIAYAAHADKLRTAEKPDLAKALELAQQAASWFSDAERLRKDDPKTKANLAIMRARVQAISDELRQGEGKLEARLDQLIGDQRSVLDDARGAWLSIKQAGGTDPLAQQGTLTHLADRERGIVAEAGVIVDLAADEIDTIGKKTEDKRSDEEKARLVQLKNLDLYVLDARERIAEARRKLQELAAQDGVTKAEAALNALKRAREQLLDPITVLRGVAQDQVVLLKETAYAGAADGSLELDVAQAPPKLEDLPAWLEPAMIADRQGGLRDRLEEVRARFAGASEQPIAPPQPGQPVDPKQAQQVKLLERVVAAIPSIIEASEAMNRAREALGAKQLKPAVEHERTALIALSRAIEQFADLKQTVELAYADHKQLQSLLTPEAAKQLSADERSKETRDNLARNAARITRLKELIADEVAAVDAPADPSKPPDEAAKKELEQKKQMLARAEELRGQAQIAIDQLTAALAANKDPLPPAKTADEKLTELRKLLFSVIEHLQELIREQGETRDQTSVAHGEDPFSREPKLPTLLGRQDGHGELAKAITEVLAAQADEAGKQQGPAQPGAPDPKTLSAAAGEVRLAQSDMTDASGTLTKARDATTASESLEPAVKSQAKAIEHLEAALRLLQPPKDQDQKQDQQQQQQQQQAKEDKDKQDQQPAGGASQRARDEDARRQRERRKQQSQSDPVEKDW